MRPIRSTLWLLPGILMVAGCTRILPPDVPADAEIALAMRQQLQAAGGTAATVLALPDPQGFATLQGVFRISGTPPSRRPLSVTGDDASYCTASGQLLDEQLVVGPNDGIRDVLIFLNTDIPTDNPLWIHEQYEATKTAILADEQGFDQERCRFLSHVFAMRSTQKLEIINSDPIGHNTNIQGGGQALSSNQSLPANSESIYEPGGQAKAPFPVTCSIHPWMKAWMITRDSPYFAVTAEDGTFAIANIPAGVELEFRAWQEKAKFLGEVTVNGQAQKWSKGRFKITLQPGETRQLEVVIDASAFN